MQPSLRRSRSVLVAVLALIASLVVGVSSPAAAVPGTGSTVFINELHYDNVGTDAGEFIEVAGPAGTDLTGWSLVLYNGANGAAYDTISLSGLIADAGQGYGFAAFNRPINGIQNGAPDGMALVDPLGVVRQLLSYEGELTPTGGPALGLVSTDIGVSENGTEPIGLSLQLSGTGDTADDFTWNPPAAETPGAANLGQTFDAGGTGGPGMAFPFSEGFDIDDCTATGWQVVSVDTDQANTWTCSAASSYADTNGFGDSAPADEWLISPDFNMGAQIDETLRFRNFTNFTDAGYPQLEVLYSSDYDGAGDPSTATWTALTGVTFSPEGSGQFVDSGAVDLSTITGSNVYFAFHYTSTGTSAGSAANWRVDAVEFGIAEPPEPVQAKLHEVQGSGSTVAITGEVEVTAIVTSLFEDDDALNGFFLQEEDADVDADPLTSEGIFVFCGFNCTAGLAVGDQVTVTGLAEEFFGMSQVDISGSGGSATINSSANVLPSAAPVSLPADGSTLSEGTFEAVEGMIVTFADELVVSEYFELARYGQLVLTADARPSQFTDGNAPSVAGYADFLSDLARHRIILDDNNNDQNDRTSGPLDNEPYAYPTPGLSLTNNFRGGDSISDLTGVLHWSFAGQGGTDAWRIRPVDGLDYTFTSQNQRGVTPPDVGGTTKVASFNVLNYFTTLDVRGADSVAELQRQRDKIVTALLAIDADVVGLIEIENDSGASVADLVDALNAAAGAGTYDYVDTGTIGTDEIKVAFIYQPAAVSAVGPYAILDSSVDPTFIDTANRPALIQTFEEVSGGGRFTAAVNHLKSKGSACDDIGDPDLNDGQANCNLTRTAAAAALANYLATDPTGSGDGDVLILGDLNAYAMEDPISTLEAAGYTDLLEQFVGSDAYSFLFDGQLGYLDHGLANAELLPQVTGTATWNINADEVSLFDYNDDIRDPGEASFERESNALPIYDTSPFRSSDHDPVIIGLDLRDSGLVFVSSTSGGTIGGVGFADEDIVAYDRSTDSWLPYFDGSDVGLSWTDVDAFSILDDGSLLFSFTTLSHVTGIGFVDDSDLVRFVPTSLGDNTAGAFELYFDGSDVGLSSLLEDIDAVSVLADGRLVLSTSALGRVTGNDGRTLWFRDEDLLVFTPSTLGSATSGTFELYIDGSDIGLTRSDEDVWGVSVDAGGDLQLVTKGAFAVDGLAGGRSDVFTCVSATTGDPSACDSFALLFDADAAGFGSETVDALHVELAN